MTDIVLKFGRIKAFSNGNEQDRVLLDQYYEANEPAKEKEIICKIIDSSPDEKFYLWFDSAYVDKTEAKKYIMDYKLDVNP